MKVVIIEDETLAAEKLADFIAQYNKEAEVVTVLDCIKSALTWFQENEMPDLVFSDIELLDGNVFKLFDHVDITCPIIFTTSYNQYLLDAFKVNGIAYLLKPFDYNSFSTAISKYKKLEANFKPIDNKFLKDLRSVISSDKVYKKRFSVKTNKGIILINTNDIAYIKVINGMVHAFLKSGKKYVLNHSMSQLEDVLDPNGFFRINRSEIINIDYIERLEPYFNDRLSIKVVDSNEKLITSTSRTPELRKWIDR